MTVTTNDTLRFFPMKFTSLYKDQQLSIGLGAVAVAVVTGWTQVEKVSPCLSAKEYCTIGNLYSGTQGLSYLIRNLLYNPQISQVVLLSATKMDSNSRSVAIAFEFLTGNFSEGVDDLGRKCWKTPIGGMVDGNIPFESLIALSNRLVVNTFGSIQELVEYVKSLPVVIPTAKLEREKFPEYEIVKSTQLPAPYVGGIIRVKSVAQGFLESIYRVRTSGKLKETNHGLKWQELQNMMIVVEDNFDLPIPNYLPVDIEFLENYIPQICEDSPETLTSYTYGSRMRSHFGVDQVELVIEKLRNDPTVASAVISLWDVQKDRNSTPCLNHIWFRISDDRLYMTATLRSNDMFGAWCANIIGLRSLQILVANQLNIFPASLTTVSLSAHIYEDCFTYVDATLDKYRKPLFIPDAIGNFLIQWNPTLDLISVTHEFPDGVKCREYFGLEPSEILKRIIHDSPQIAPSHAGYLGLRLSECLRMKDSFIQD